MDHHCFTTIRIGACSQDLMYLKGYESMTDGHVLKYHRECFEPEEFEVDNRRADVPVDSANEVGDVQGHCDGICSKVYSSMVESCSGSECKAQVS
jgi:hypothetical protein